MDLTNNHCSHYDKKALDSVLIAAAKQGVSDIALKSKQRISFVHHDKVIIDSINKPVTDTELDAYLNHIHVSSATALLAQSRDLDFSYSIRIDRSKSIRFRVNATTVLLKGGNIGFELIFRVLSETPPSLEDLSVEVKFSDALVSNKNKAGIVWVTGPTGSGKSTLLSAVLRHKLQNEEDRFLSYEAPIEYLYDGVPKMCGTISQSEIPTHLPNFVSATRNALRRKARVVLIGEARDQETISGVIDLSSNGHLVFSTAHTNNTYSFIEVLSSKFNDSQESKRGAAISLLSHTNCVVHQDLVSAIDGGLIGVRELLPLNKKEHKDYVISKASNDENFLSSITFALKELVRDYGVTKSAHAEELFKDGKITKRTLFSIQSQEDWKARS